MRRNILFLCTGNSARSIIAEAILIAHGGEHFKAYSAGSHPKGHVHPLALETLSRQGYDITGLRSKSWDEFATPTAPHIDFVITLCDEAAGEACPAFPGKPVRAHWRTVDPSATSGSADAQRAAFRETLAELRRRIQRFTGLPFDTLEPAVLAARVAEVAAELA